MRVRAPSSAPNEKNPNPIFPVGDGFGFFAFSKKSGRMLPKGRDQRNGGLNGRAAASPTYTSAVLSKWLYSKSLCENNAKSEK